MFENLFDFSKVKKADMLTRVWGSEIWEARVTQVTLESIECEVIVDTCRHMRFDAKTGVAFEGADYGFIVNAPCSYDDDFRKKLFEMLDKISRYDIGQ